MTESDRKGWVEEEVKQDCLILKEEVSRERHSTNMVAEYTNIGLR